MTRGLLQWLAPLGAGILVALLAWIASTFAFGPPVNPFAAGFAVFLIGRGVNAAMWLVEARPSAFDEP